MIGSHRDKLKHYIFRGAISRQASSSRLLLALKAVFVVDVRLCSMVLTYFQSRRPLESRIFILNLAPEFELDPSMLFELLRSLKALCHAENLQHESPL